ncbi:MAG TPA: hypothetical protein VJ248_09765 [Candidatus Udaeobacter sp.]|nr:hypothetical protein [Candidatus Udaeobacter sp.]
MLWFILGLIAGFLFCAACVPGLIEYRARLKIPTEYKGKKYMIFEEEKTE